MLTALLGFTGCAARPAAPTSKTPAAVEAPPRAYPTHEAVRSAEPVIFVLAGRRVLIPIVQADESAAPGAWLPAREPDLTFVTGEAIEIEVAWISGSARTQPRAWEWLPPTAGWRSLTLEEVRVQLDAGHDPLASPGFWTIVADLPARASGRELRLDDRPLSVRWLPDPPARTDARRAPQPRATPAALRALGELLREESADPLRRWRVRLMLDRWSAEQLWGADPPPRELATPALEALAAQNEWRWRAALAALARSGPDTAADVLSRLTAVVLSPRGVLLPAWPLDDAGSARLRAAMLRADTGDDDRLNEAQAWLASQPPAIAWVIDDGPIITTASGEKPTAPARRVRAAVAELTGKRASVALTAEGAPPGEARMVEEHESLVFSVDAPVGTRAIEPLRVQAGRWTGRIGFRATPMSASPPGLTLGPLIPQWTMLGWLNGNAGQSDADWATAGLLRRSEDGSAWEVYVECRVAADAGQLVGDTVRVFWGSETSPDHVIELKAPMRDEARNDRWSASVLLPSRAIDADGMLRLSLERTDARGARSSWPRTVMPGDAEPPRAIITLDAWDR